MVSCFWTGLVRFKCRSMMSAIVEYEKPFTPCSTSYAQLASRHPLLRLERKVLWTEGGWGMLSSKKRLVDRPLGHAALHVVGELGVAAAAVGRGWPDWD